MNRKSSSSKRAASLFGILDARGLNRRASGKYKLALWALQRCSSILSREKVQTYIYSVRGSPPLFETASLTFVLCVYIRAFFSPPPSSFLVSFPFFIPQVSVSGSAEQAISRFPAFSDQFYFPFSFMSTAFVFYLMIYRHCFAS